jgi:hypothetical protein
LALIELKKIYKFPKIDGSEKIDKEFYYENVYSHIKKTLHKKSELTVSIKEAFTSASYRRASWNAIFTFFFDCFVGFNAILILSTKIFKNMI